MYYKSQNMEIAQMSNNKLVDKEVAQYIQNGILCDYKRKRYNYAVHCKVGGIGGIMLRKINQRKNNKHPKKFCY